MPAMTASVWTRMSSTERKRFLDHLGSDIGPLAARAAANVAAGDLNRLGYLSARVALKREMAKLAVARLMGRVQAEEGS